jgi:hypothetical protein
MRYELNSYSILKEIGCEAKSIFMNPAGSGTENDFAGEDQQQLNQTELVFKSLLC